MPTSIKNKISSPFSKTNQHDQKYKTIISAASELFNVQGTRGTTLSNPGLKVILPKLRPAISWHSLGCEKISTTSGPFRSKSLRAFLRVSFTRMSSALPRSRFNLSSDTLSVSQSPRTLPVERLQTFLLNMVSMHGLPGDVVPSLDNCLNVIATMPDSISCQT